MRSVAEAPRSILICNIRLIGDVVLSTPLVELFKQQYPKATIDFLVNRGTGEFLEKDPRIRRVFYSEKWGQGNSRGGSSYLWLLMGNYDLAVCLNASDRGTLATLFAGRRVRLGYFEPVKRLGAFCRKMLLSHPLLFDEELHPVARCRQVADALGVLADTLKVQVFWDEADRQQVAANLLGTWVGADYFVLHPFARWRYKYWDIKRFAKVSDHIARHYGLQPVWTSSPDVEEKQQLVTAATECDIPPHLIAGCLSLNQMACLLHGARLYLGLDTAITHIAASTGVPTVALYGPTEIWRWHPWDNAAKQEDALSTGYRGAFRSGNVVALQAECKHYPCIRPQCYLVGTENPCLMALNTEIVCAEIDIVMQRAEIRDNYSTQNFAYHAS